MLGCPLPVQPGSGKDSPEPSRSSKAVLVADGRAALLEGSLQLVLRVPSSLDPLQHMSMLTRSCNPVYDSAQLLSARPSDNGVCECCLLLAPSLAASRTSSRRWNQFMHQATTEKLTPVETRHCMHVLQGVKMQVAESGLQPGSQILKLHGTTRSQLARPLAHLPAVAWDAGGLSSSSSSELGQEWAAPQGPAELSPSGARLAPCICPDRSAICWWLVCC